MAKVKLRSKENRRVPNKHLHSRISFLHQAAQYLSSQAQSTYDTEKSSERSIKSTKSNNVPEEATKSVSGERSDKPTTPSTIHCGQALRLSSHLMAVSQRSKVLVSEHVKRSICKCCNELLVPGRTATHHLENKSKEGKKPWADVLVVQCERCGFQKRYPVGQQRQAKKKDRLGR